MALRTSDFIARLGFTTYALLVALLAISSNNWIAVIRLGCSGGSIYIWLMLISVVLLTIDMIINDLMPERFEFAWGLRVRHWVYPVVSFAFAAILFIAEQKHKSVPIDAVAVYSSMSVMGLMLSFRNLLLERGRLCNKR
jgi:hypothetical protein